ncbi:ABC transporter ATP-binding protein [Kribbella pittospori]|uniref:ABC transporter ATP-binding protein n=1 Tax=Kribbella pittospori TaxID=722689 RepID=A0A4R0KP74_9ACTN|nr:ABC transporter ATP-binding protein [Kribbella pittospori]TCC61144.1 ABC transporter ATP-binding protein [Kribbella pittospori]
MRRELAFGAAALRRRPTLLLAAWSVPEILPTAAYGIAVAHATDAFLGGRSGAGLCWLAGLVAAAGLGAVGARQVYRRLGELVEPFRDELVRLVVGGALRRGVAGQRTDGALSRMNRQVEIVRDTYAGLILVTRTFAVTVVGVVTGLLSLAPIIALLVVPPFLLGFAASLAILGTAAQRVAASLSADEHLTTAAGTAFAGVRDITSAGAEDFAADLVGEPIDAHAAAERALAKVAALRTLCFAIGGWLPLLVLLATGPWLIGRGISTGTLLGGLTYVLLGLQPALNTVMAALGDSGLRFVVTLGRILDSGPPARRQLPAVVPRGHQVRLHKVSFTYGAHAEPVLRALDLVVPDGDHLAVVGPSGIGKSTLAGLVCGLLPPTEGRVLVGRVAPGELSAELLARTRVLIPQEAYVFSGTVADNLTYLAPHATAQQLEQAIEAVGAAALVARLGGTRAMLRPAQLSAGERQLVALARAYLSPAPLAVLDEATCHLDPEAERRAEEAFAARPGSLIVVAHRISSALRAHRILVLDGKEASLGRHTTLVRTSELYRDLLGHWQPPHDREDQIQPAS